MRASGSKKLLGEHFNYGKRQALEWPWAGDMWLPSRTDERGSFWQLPAGVGSTDEKFVNTALHIYFDDKEFDGGALYVWLTPSRNAPLFEIVDIKSFSRATWTITIDKLTHTLAGGCTCILLFPPPPWLKDAQCEQAYSILEEKSGAANMYSQGIQSQSTPEGVSTSFRDAGRSGHLCRLTQTILDAHLSLLSVGLR